MIDLVQHIEAVAAPLSRLDPGWNLYDHISEFSRLGVATATNAWRLTTVNSDYSLCDTYPCLFAVPSSVSDEMLMSAARFRSRGRIPILSYLHKDNMVRPRLFFFFFFFLKKENINP